MNKLTKYACILTALAGAVACSDGKKAQGDYAVIPLPQEKPKVETLRSC